MCDYQIANVDGDEVHIKCGVCGEIFRKVDMTDRISCTIKNHPHPYCDNNRGFAVIRVIDKFKVMGLDEHRMQNNYWHQEEDDFIRHNYKKLTDNELSAILCRSHGSVASRRVKMGLGK